MSLCEQHDHYEGWCKLCATAPLSGELAQLQELAQATVDGYDVGEDIFGPMFYLRRFLDQTRP
jgi:hypothetical protein